VFQWERRGLEEEEEEEEEDSRNPRAVIVHSV
jgi:hypothetical protein